MFSLGLAFWMIFSTCLWERSAGSRVTLSTLVFGSIGRATPFSVTTYNPPSVGWCEKRDSELLPRYHQVSPASPCIDILSVSSKHSCSPLLLRVRGKGREVICV